MNHRSLLRLLARIERQRDDDAVRRRERTPKAERPRCGAQCRDGHACQAPAVWDRERGCVRNGRCRMHGGLSTGPKTAEGKLRSREGALRGARISAERRRKITQDNLVLVLNQKTAQEGREVC
jgi:hypothetical protein